MDFEFTRFDFTSILCLLYIYNSLYILFSQVPYPNIEFDKDFLEGITKIEQHKAPIKSDESVSIMLFISFKCHISLT